MSLITHRSQIQNHANFKQISISMSASNKKSRERIVHLGSKSPRNHNQTQHHPNFYYQSESPKQNLSIIIPSPKPNHQMKENHPIIHDQHLPIIYPEPNKLTLKHAPIQRHSRQNSFSKIMTIHQNSPQKSIILKETAPVINSQIKADKHQLENELVRKNKILEQRILELHQQKQNGILKLHEENQKLNVDNIFLKQKINQLQQRVQNTPKAQKQQNLSKMKSNSSLGNGMELQKQTDRHETSILQKEGMYRSLERNSDRDMSVVVGRLNQSLITQKHQQTVCNHQQEIAELRKICDQFSEKIKQLQTLNEQVLQQKQTQKKQHEERVEDLSEQKKHLLTEKEELGLRLRKYEEERQSLLGDKQNLSLQNNELNNQLIQMKNTILQNSSAISKNHQTIIQQYQHQINTLNSQLLPLQETISQLNLQVQEQLTCIQQLKAQNVTLREDMQRVKNEHQANEGRLCQREQENKRLYGKIEEMEEKCRACRKEDKEIQVEGFGVMSDCLKCKQLMRTFMKLNCKTYQK